MRIKTNVKAGGINMQHNQRITCSLKIKSGVKAGFHFVKTINSPSPA